MSPLAARATTDVAEYLERVGDFLAQRPVQHSVLLNVAGNARTTPSSDPSSELWLWVQNGAGGVVAAAHLTPPHPAYLSTGPDDAVRLLAATLRERRPALTGVGGLRPHSKVFADEWARLGGPPSTVEMAQGVYVVDTVTPPAGVDGRLRPAVPADGVLLGGWAADFAHEALGSDDPQDRVSHRIRAGLLFVWEVEGEAVSMAAITPARSGVSRVNLVWTPQPLRRQGYASACVAALTARELSTPGRTCMLFTDLANPTSNGIYRRIGYRLVGEGEVRHFAVERGERA